MFQRIVATIGSAQRGGGTLERAGNALYRSLIDLALPPSCRFCGEPIAGEDFCRVCARQLRMSEPLMRSACDRCGLPRPRLAASCPHCPSQYFAFARVVALWSYQQAVCEAVIAAKYSHQAALADALGRALGGLVADRLSEQLPEVVTFVPSHFTRQFSRGGNGNAAIARAVARRIARPCQPLLQITRRIAKQALLDDAGRRQNVRGAFREKKSYAFGRQSRLGDRHVLLVDDVLTTGSTANEAAGALLGGGARRVTLAVVARTLRS